MGHIQPRHGDSNQSQAEILAAQAEQTSALLQQLSQQLDPELQRVYELNKAKEAGKARLVKTEEKDEAGVKLYKIHAGGQERQMKYLQVMNFIKQNEPRQVSRAIAATSQM